MSSKSLQTGTGRSELCWLPGNCRRSPYNFRCDSAIAGSQREILVSCIFLLKMLAPITPKAASLS